MTLAIGLNVSLYYGEGYTITFSEEKTTINVEDIKEIAKEIWGNDYLVQNVEFFNDSAVIKVKNYNDEQIKTLFNKINEKYQSELDVSTFKVEHESNVKISTLVEPYIVPIGISLLLVLVYYAIRYRGANQMLNLVKWLFIVETLIYGAYAICRLPINKLSIPIAMIAYILTVAIYTCKAEFQEKEEK